MTTKDPSFSKRRIIHNQTVIQLLAVFVGVFSMATPILFVLLLPYVEILLVLWVLTSIICLSIAVWERRNPKV
jgi:hypothetical protein